MPNKIIPSTKEQFTTQKKLNSIPGTQLPFFVLAKVAPPTHYVDIPNGNLRAIKSSRLALLKKFTGHKYLFSSNNFCCKAYKNAVHQSL